MHDQVVEAPTKAASALGCNNALRQIASCPKFEQFPSLPWQCRRPKVDTAFGKSTPRKLFSVRLRVIRPGRLGVQRRWASPTSNESEREMVSTTNVCEAEDESGGDFVCRFRRANVVSEESSVHTDDCFAAPFPTCKPNTNGKNGRMSTKLNGVRDCMVEKEIRELKKQSWMHANGDVHAETRRSTRELRESFERPSLLTAFLTQVGFYILMFLGYLSQAFFPPKMATETNREGFPPLYNKFVSFYSLYLYRRIRDCWNYPVCSVPGAEIVLKDRVTDDYGWTFRYTGSETKCLNLGSYNYLGFAQNSGKCADAAIDAIHKYGVSTCSSRQKYGTCGLHIELEKLLAEFLGVEDTITFGMGFATNSLNLPVILSPGCLVASDGKNHASLILGIRLSGATVKVFKHNDMADLEKLLKEAIFDGQPKSETKTADYVPWRKILIVVEGVYSMEGTLVRLPEIIALKKKYKAYLYLDEAHSIGAMGPNGRGVVDYFGCNPRDIDIMMGTFTKSFGAAGGYIAGDRELISYIRKNSLASKYATAMSPPVAAQIVSVLRILMGKDGTNEGMKRIQSLARNTKYFRKRLHQIGLVVYGNEDSPVVPILVYLYSKISAMVRILLKHKIASVGVGYPATPLMEGRIRICLSAAHTKEQLDYALDTIEKVADELGLKYSRKPIDKTPIDYDALEI